MTTEPTYEQFMARVDRIIMKLIGLGYQDFCDACWYDLFEATEGRASVGEICETLAEADDLFAGFLEENGIEFE